MTGALSSGAGGREGRDACLRASRRQWPQAGLYLHHRHSRCRRGGGGFSSRGRWQHGLVSGVTHRRASSPSPAFRAGTCHRGGLRYNEMLTGGRNVIRKGSRSIRMAVIPGYTGTPIASASASTEIRQCRSTHPKGAKRVASEMGHHPFVGIDTVHVV